jgi:hypothetical protein
LITHPFNEETCNKQNLSPTHAPFLPASGFYPPAASFR